MALAWLQAQTSVLATEAASRGLMHLKISFLGRLELVKCFPRVCFVPGPVRVARGRVMGKIQPDPRLAALWGRPTSCASPQQKYLVS